MADTEEDSLSGTSLTGVRLTVGVVISVATGIVLYFFTNTVSILSFVVGLQITLLTLQAEALLRERHQDDEATRQDRILRSIERVKWLPDVIEKITQSVAAAEEKYPSTIVAETARRTLENCTNELARLEFGQVVLDYAEIGPLVSHAEKCRTSIRSTSLQSVDLEWWLSPLGRRYWQSTLAALNRGVHCERIFIYHDWSAELDGLANEQAAGGVHVLRVHRDKLPPQLRLDVIVWDGFCGYETRSNEHGEGQWNYFTFQAEGIRQIITNYNLIYNSSVDLKGDTEKCILH